MGRMAILLCAAAIVILAAAAPARATPFKLIITETETPLVPNSVLELAKTLGYYARAGVEVELLRVQQTPSAVAALHSGDGDMANISFDAALELVARDQMKLKGVISPDKALPFLIVAKTAIAAPKDLEGKVFGIARIGSNDYTLSRVVLTKLGIDVDTLQYLATGQPAVRAQALAAGRIDATAISIGVWSTMPERSALKVMVDQAEFYRLAPFVGKLNVVTAAVAAAKAKEITGVVRGIIMASRDFAATPGLWTDAMAAARPDVDRGVLNELAAADRKSWRVAGGLAPEDVKSTTDTLYRGSEFKELRRVEPSEWIDTTFIDAALQGLGPAPGSDPATP
jgi:NitT/TauT family transport system substrate-binding protein